MITEFAQFFSSAEKNHLTSGMNDVTTTINDELINNQDQLTDDEVAIMLSDENGVTSVPLDPTTQPLSVSDTSLGKNISMENSTQKNEDNQGNDHRLENDDGNRRDNDQELDEDNNHHPDEGDVQKMMIQEEGEDNDRLLKEGQKEEEEKKEEEEEDTNFGSNSNEKQEDNEMQRGNDSGTNEGDLVSKAQIGAIESVVEGDEDSLLVPAPQEEGKEEEEAPIQATEEGAVEPETQRGSVLPSDGEVSKPIDTVPRKRNNVSRKRNNVSGRRNNVSGRSNNVSKNSVPEQMDGMIPRQDEQPRMQRRAIGAIAQSIENGIRIIKAADRSNSIDSQSVDSESVDGGRIDAQRSQNPVDDGVEVSIQRPVLMEEEETENGEGDFFNYYNIGDDDGIVFEGKNPEFQNSENKIPEFQNSENRNPENENSGNLKPKLHQKHQSKEEERKVLIVTTEPSNHHFQGDSPADDLDSILSSISDPGDQAFDTSFHTNEGSSYGRKNQQNMLLPPAVAADQPYDDEQTFQSEDEAKDGTENEAKDDRERNAEGRKGKGNMQIIPRFDEFRSLSNEQKIQILMSVLSSIRSKDFENGMIIDNGKTSAFIDGDDQMVD